MERTVIPKTSGIEIIRAWIDIFKPSFLLIILRGLSTRKSLNTLRMDKSDWKNKSIIDKITIVKSMQFQAFLK